ELLAEIVEREVALGELGLLLLNLLLIELRLDLGDLLDDAHQVALAEDALGHALRLEFVEHVELFADTDELDGDLCDFLDGEGSAAAGVADELRQDDAVEVQGVVEGLRAVDGV